MPSFFPHLFIKSLLYAQPSHSVALGCNDELRELSLEHFRCEGVSQFNQQGPVTLMHVSVWFGG